LGAAAAATGLSLPCFLPVPESQPVLPALLRRLLQHGALPEALALATRHEGGPHFKRSLEWLLFTTLDMEGGKCKPSKAGGSGQQQPLHVLPAAGAVLPGAYAGVLGRQGKVRWSERWHCWSRDPLFAMAADTHTPPCLSASLLVPYARLAHGPGLVGPP
jgi:hypothetical protein